MIRCGLGCAGAAVLAWFIFAALPATSTPFTASPEIESVVNANTAFAVDLYQKLKDRPGNLFFSPYSISTALAMTYAGARETTEAEMAKALHFQLPQDGVHAAFGGLISRMEKIQRWNQIKIASANSLWCQKEYPFTAGFLKLIRANYHAEAQLVDFRSAPRTACGEINAWVDRQTKGRIKEVFDPTQITHSTQLLLIDSIYFKGKWKIQFKPKDTQPAAFYVDTNTTVSVPMMRQEAHFKMTYAGQRGQAQMLELPYFGEDLSMIILMPDTRSGVTDGEQVGLSGLEGELTPDNLRAWIARLDGVSLNQTRVSLPRFTTTQSLELVNELKSLGMNSVFTADANLSGMDGTTNLYLAEVIHKAFCEVDEAGTEAAAATVAFVRTKGMTGSFVADHPFIFLIRDNASGSILFLGRIVDPTRQ